MKAKKLLSVITSATVGLSMLLGSGVTQAFASAIDTDAFIPVRYSNQTVTTTISGDYAETTTTPVTTGIITTTTTTTNNDYNCPEYPVSGEKVVSISVYDEDTGYNIFGNVDVTARLLTTEDINNDTEGTEIASWNLDQENIQPYALTVPYTVEYEGQMLFIGIYIDNYTDISYNDIQETLLIFDPFSEDVASFMYEVPLDKSYVTTLAPLDYCECCGKDLELGEGLRSPLGLYICQDCSDAGLGGTTTAPQTTTQIEYCDCCGYGVSGGNGVYTIDGFFYCNQCVDEGLVEVHTTTTTTTTTTTINTHTTPRNVICDGCGYGAFEYNGQYVGDLFYCYECVEDGLATAITTTPTTVTTLNTHTTPRNVICDGCGYGAFEYNGQYVGDLFYCYECVEKGLATTTTTADVDYCDCCGADIPEGQGYYTPLGLYICQACKDAGAGYRNRRKCSCFLLR